MTHLAFDVGELCVCPRTLKVHKSHLSRALLYGVNRSSTIFLHTIKAIPNDPNTSRLFGINRF